MTHTTKKNVKNVSSSASQHGGKKKQQPTAAPAKPIQSCRQCGFQKGLQKDLGDLQWYCQGCWAKFEQRKPSEPGVQGAVKGHHTAKHQPQVQTKVLPQAPPTYELKSQDHFKPMDLSALPNRTPLSFEADNSVPYHLLDLVLMYRADLAPTGATTTAAARDAPPGVSLNGGKKKKKKGPASAKASISPHATHAFSLGLVSKRWVVRFKASESLWKLLIQLSDTSKGITDTGPMFNPAWCCDNPSGCQVALSSATQATDATLKTFAATISDAMRIDHSPPEDPSLPRDLPLACKSTTPSISDPDQPPFDALRFHNGHSMSDASLLCFIPFTLTVLVLQNCFQLTELSVAALILKNPSIRTLLLDTCPKIGSGVLPIISQAAPSLTHLQLTALNQATFTAATCETFLAAPSILRFVNAVKFHFKPSDQMPVPAQLVVECFSRLPALKDLLLLIATEKTHATLASVLTSYVDGLQGTISPFPVKRAHTPGKTPTTAIKRLSKQQLETLTIHYRAGNIYTAPTVTTYDFRASTKPVPDQLLTLAETAE